jgi:hypothetical protein
MSVSRSLGDVSERTVCKGVPQVLLRSATGLIKTWMTCLENTRNKLRESAFIKAGGDHDQLQS